MSKIIAVLFVGLVFMVIIDTIIGFLGVVAFHQQIPTLLNLIGGSVVPSDLIQVMELGAVTAIDIIVGFGGSAKLLEYL